MKTQTRHTMSFPTALTERARALPAKETRLACIYLKASCLFQDGENSSLLNDDILGATLGGVSITNLSQPVEIRFWHNLRPANNFNMTCVFWMEGEGFHLYMLVIRVYNLYIRRYLLKLCAVGCGLPGLAVMTIFLINKQAYGIHSIETNSPHGNETMCWITSTRVQYFNLIYLSGTVLFNMTILTLVVRQLRRLGANFPQQKEHSCRDMVTVLGLTCLLGATWTPAIFSFGVFSIPLLFLFTILNSLQGLVICLWYCTLRCRSQASVSGGTSHPSSQ
ncbi:UNVERIFIED_CONTAM: hypothetical protein K2H54_029489 [Gekko kuhli]